MSSKKYEDLIARKKDILEKVRKEREQLQREKQARSEEKSKEKSISEIKTKEELDLVIQSFGIPALSQTTIIKPTSPKQEIPTISAKTVPDSVSDRKGDISKKLLKLSFSPTTITDIQPKEIFTSSKSTQTNISRLPLKIVIPVYDENEDEYHLPEGGFVSKLPPGCMSPGLPKLHFVEPAVTNLDNIREESTEVKELTEDEKHTILCSKNFQNTLKRLGSIMENVVAKNVNITKDYIRGQNYDEDDARARGRVALNCTLSDSHWTAKRCVTSMDWSAYNPEMMAASYHINEDEPLEPDGIVIVWNTKSKKQTPEYIFHSPSAVLSTCFAKFNPNLILGGTYSGQIVIWDMRSPKHIPVQSTTLSCGAHIQPINSMHMVGNQNSHNLISSSAEGKLCSWSLDMLSEPVETLLLEKPEKRPVATTCMAFPNGQTNSILVGSEDGLIYKASSFGFNAGIIGKFSTHEDPVTSISVHCSNSSMEFNDLFLTSSMDCTIKLWSLNNTDEALHTFRDNFDYIMDVAWSPVHPALFAAVDGSGRLDLWNFNVGTETPLVSMIVNGQPALNRLSWSENGSSISVGDVDGKIYLYDIAERVSQPLPGECSVFSNAIKSLELNSKSTFQD